MFLDFTQYNMSLIGGFIALVVFGIFIGTWWWYAMRAPSTHHAAPAAPPESAPKRLGRRTAEAR